MSWNSIKDLPKDDEQYVLFVHWIQLDSKNKDFPPLMLEDEADQWKNIKTFRSYQLENSYTHWIALGNPPKS